MIKSVATGLEGHQVGERVELIREPDYVGTIVLVEENKLSCQIVWDGEVEEDFQWANKLQKNTP